MINNQCSLFECYLEAKNLRWRSFTKSTCIACIGSKAYKLLRSLTKNDTKSKTYEQYVKLVTDHISLMK